MDYILIIADEVHHLCVAVEYLFADILHSLITVANGFPVYFLDNDSCFVMDSA